MVIFNLLPWRQYEQKYYKRVSKIIFLLSGLLALMIIVIVHAGLSKKMTRIKNRTTLLTEEINRYHEQVKRDNHIHEYTSDTIKKIFKHREINKKLLAALGNMHREEVCFMEISRIKNTLSFNGQASSVADLTQFLTHWNEVSFFEQIRIQQIEQIKDGLVRFAFQAEEGSMQS